MAATGSKTKTDGYGPFTEEEMTVLLEAARIGLSDAENFDGIAEQTDLSDETLAELRDRLQAFLG